MFRRTCLLPLRQALPQWQPAMQRRYLKDGYARRQTRLAAPPQTWSQRMVTRLEDAWAHLQRQRLLFKHLMVKHRLLSLRFGPDTKYSFVWTVSNVCGHGSFLFLMASYLETDFLNLRLYAFSGITLSMVFQYYRENPLWIPIRWNSLFLVINTLMILRLLKEKSDALFISGDERKVFENLFERRGMKQEDFMKLMQLAERKEVPHGEKLIVQGRTNNHVYLVVSGSLQVNKNGHFISRLKPFSFAGEMSFLRWQGNVTSLEGGEVSTATVECTEDCVLYSWHFRDLDHIMRKNPVCGMMFESSISNDMNRKLNHDEHNKVRRDYEALLRYVVGCFAPFAPRSRPPHHPLISTSHLTPYQINNPFYSTRSGAIMDGEITDREKHALDEYRQQHNIAHEEHFQLIKTLGWSAEEYAVGSRGCVRSSLLRISVFWSCPLPPRSFPFFLLFVTAMDSGSGPAPEKINQYRELLSAELSSGVLSSAGRARLRNFRRVHHINADKHMDMCRYHNDPHHTPPHLVLCPVAPSRLIHMLLLYSVHLIRWHSELGWTFDEFEDGKRAPPTPPTPTPAPTPTSPPLAAAGAATVGTT